MTNLVILNQQDTGYSLDLRNHVYRQIVKMRADAWLNQPDGIFLLHTDQMPKADMVLLETVARVILDYKNGPLAEQLGRLTEQPTRLPTFMPTMPGAEDPEPTPSLARPAELLMDNGLGGFNTDGHEYIVYLHP